MVAGITSDASQPNDPVNTFCSRQINACTHIQPICIQRERQKGGVETGGAHHYIAAEPTGMSELERACVFCYCLMMIFMLELRCRGKCEPATFVLIKQVADDSRVPISRRVAKKPAMSELWHARSMNFTILQRALEAAAPLSSA